MKEKTVPVERNTIATQKYPLSLIISFDFSREYKNLVNMWQKQQSLYSLTQNFSFILEIPSHDERHYLIIKKNSMGPPS